MQWLLVPAAYGLGSISFGILLVGRLEDRDLRQMGSGNAGATNVLRSVGRLPALVVLLLDISKGVAPILLGRRLGVAGPVLGAAAVAVVLGHMYPVFHGFRGGKGVATAAGALGALQWQLLALSGLSFVVVVALTRYVSLASILGVTTYAVLASSQGASSAAEAWLPAASGAIAALVIWGHRSNIQRLLTHRETRLGERNRS